MLPELTSPCSNLIPKPTIAIRRKTNKTIKSLTILFMVLSKSILFIQFSIKFIDHMKIEKVYISLRFFHPQTYICNLG